MAPYLRDLAFIINASVVVEVSFAKSFYNLKISDKKGSTLCSS